MESGREPEAAHQTQAVCAPCEGETPAARLYHGSNLAFEDGLLEPVSTDQDALAVHH